MAHWQEATSYLENAVLNTPENEACYKPLAELYWQLDENDLLYAVWKARMSAPEIQAGIAFEQCGRWKNAQAEYFNMMLSMQRAHMGNATIEEVPNMSFAMPACFGVHCLF